VKNKLNAVISARQEFIDNTAAPFTASLGIEGKFLKYFIIKGNAAQHYRIPTFNDLYWAQGGNSDLKSEKGWSEELSLVHKHFYKTLEWELGATVFNRNIDNWIRSLRYWNINTGPIRQKGQSLIERIIRLNIPGLPRGRGKTDEELKYWYLEHKNNMMDFFQHKSNFTIFDIELDSGDKLAEFLEMQNFFWCHKNKSWPQK
jgi:hypothetical protein